MPSDHDHLLWALTRLAPLVQCGAVCSEDLELSGHFHGGVTRGQSVEGKSGTILQKMQAYRL